MDDDRDAPRPARARNRRGEGARLREEIVTAAVALLDETGDESAVTLRAVARQVGIAAPSIYRHFPDQPSIMLAVVQQAFDELAEQLRVARDAVDEPRARLFAVCMTYLGFAQLHPGRYRTMFGGLWMPDLDNSVLTESDMTALGQASLGLLAEALADCVAADLATSTDPFADSVALWLGLHGLAHQRAVTVVFPWPADLAERMITALAHLRT
ncbi:MULTISPECIES: TetR/AcrR family transcriptional regulator [unclassified Crossiella]|uniref:TetR/AcrR family transcriptional regulator n=1 Tax=unclassified Crossiella TaxID=2620835 RepID=UPI0020003A99|nr:MULTISPECIES: TetR/AcrR family transcriptional regulator [unclassified Crossiella]MCK2243495.1 WHG domain-containing protein [Crossiella sp. S99.2]MCK2257353.1 WHG domain-containing protein [Crossiella sp. S99.1]